LTFEGISKGAIGKTMGADTVIAFRRRSSVHEDHARRGGLAKFLQLPEELDQSGVVGSAGDENGEIMREMPSPYLPLTGFQDFPMTVGLAR
jgi:hypothetical protein